MKYILFILFGQNMFLQMFILILYTYTLMYFAYAPRKSYTNSLIFKFVI